MSALFEEINVIPDSINEWYIYREFEMNVLEEKIYEELLDFYAPHFSDLSETSDFITKMYSFDWDDRIPRQMISQVQRFVTLADEIDVIRPNRDGLRIFFFKTCLEALSYLGKDDKKYFFEKFGTCFSDAGKAYILNNFKLCSLEPDFAAGYYGAYELTINDFLAIIKASRDKFVHEGNYWGIQFFANDEDSTWITSIDTDEKIFSDFKYTSVNITGYVFDTTLQYEKYRFFFVEACINYIQKYAEGKSEGKA